MVAAGMSLQWALIIRIPGTQPRPDYFTFADGDNGNAICSGSIGADVWVE